MKKLILSAATLSSVLVFCQVGVNTTAPNATLDITAKNATGTTTNPEGLLIPRVDRQKAQSMTGVGTSTLIYVNSIATGTQTGIAINIDAIGYYYYNGTAWVKLNSNSSSVNIYNSDGTLTNNRTVIQNANTLAFTGTAVNSFSVAGTTLSVDAANNRVGIGTANPLQPLHVNANSGPVRFQNLATLPTNTNSSGLVIDSNGDIYQNNTFSVEGQILRIGLNAATYTANSESALRFSASDSAAEMGNAPNNAPNFINTIVDATITDGVNAAAGQGSPTRTTDRILLQPGIYKVQVRMVGTFVAAAATNTTFIKCIVNNNEYSLTQGANSQTSSNAVFFDDYINITGSAQTIDFTIFPTTNNFAVNSNGTPGTGSSYRSLILIQRLR